MFVLDGIWWQLFFPANFFVKSYKSFILCFFVINSVFLCLIVNILSDPAWYLSAPLGWLYWTAGALPYWQSLFWCCWSCPLAFSSSQFCSGFQRRSILCAGSAVDLGSLNMYLPILAFTPSILLLYSAAELHPLGRPRTWYLLLSAIWKAPSVDGSWRPFGVVSWCYFEISSILELRSQCGHY